MVFFDYFAVMIKQNDAPGEPQQHCLHLDWLIIFFLLESNHLKAFESEKITIIERIWNIWESFMFSVFSMCLLLFFPLISDNGYIHWDLFASCWLVLTMLLPPFRQGCEAFIFFLAICCLSLFFLLSVIKFREVVHSLCLLLAQHSSSKFSETFWQKPTNEK